MKNIIISSIIAFAFLVLISQKVVAQGTITYLSNVNQTSTGSVSVGSNSWLAAIIFTGTNTGGYTLNSVELAMANASGNPSGFTVMLYGLSSNPNAPDPGSSLGTLTGSTDPVIAGAYTYTAPSDLMLSPNAQYFIVLTAETAVANGAYEWSLADTYSYNPVDGWGVGIDAAEQVAGYLQSSQGSSWGLQLGDIQFAVSASPVPEPSSEILMCIGGLGFILYRWRTKSV